MISPLDVYGEDLRTATGGGAATTWLRYEDGRTIVLDLPRWTAPAEGADSDLLARCVGATLDIGCGPGRLTRALVSQGLDCLGVDVAPVAVALARVGGTRVLHASIYDPVLDDTRWSTVLLADGNVGIGGDPVALLTRARQLLMPGGRILVELDAPSTLTSTVTVRIESSSGSTSSWFPWAHVSAADADEAAANAGLQVREQWMSGARWFADLRAAA